MPFRNRLSLFTFMNAKRLIFSLLVGSASALLTWWVFGGHFVPHHFGGAWVYLGDLIVVVSLPGLLAGMVASGSVHTGSTELAVLVNFLFYFLAANGAFRIFMRNGRPDLRLLPRQNLASRDVRLTPL